MNNRTTTGLFIAIGIVLALINLAIFSSLDSNSLGSFLRNLPAKQTQKATILPDIPAGKSYSSSSSRNEEISKIKDSLPYQPASKDYLIQLNNTTKDITVSVQATDINDYRNKKLAAELKLNEFGSTNLCLLLILWAPPQNLVDKLSSEDRRTTGCKY